MRILYFICLLFFLGCNGEKMNTNEKYFPWKVQSAAIYGISDSMQEKLSESELEKTRFAQISEVDLSSILAKARFKPLKEDESIAIKYDYRIVIFTTETGEKIRINTSNNGGIFWLLEPQWPRGYFYFPDKKDFYQWHNLFFGEGLKKFMKES